MTNVRRFFRKKKKNRWTLSKGYFSTWSACARFERGILIKKMLIQSFSIVKYAPLLLFAARCVRGKLESRERAFRRHTDVSNELCLWLIMLIYQGSARVYSSSVFREAVWCFRPLLAHFKCRINAHTAAVNLLKDMTSFYHNSKVL